MIANQQPCPHCHGPHGVSTLAILLSSPLRSRQCGSCGKSFYLGLGAGGWVLLLLLPVPLLPRAFGVPGVVTAIALVTAVTASTMLWAGKLTPGFKHG